jgi:hypothetical protein
MIIDPKEYFKIDYKEVLKEQGIKGIPKILRDYLLMTVKIFLYENHNNIGQI